MELEEIASVAIDCGFKLHKRPRPGLLESVYEVILFESLRARGLRVQRLAAIKIQYDDFVIKDSLKADLLVEGKLLIELKSVENNATVHKKTSAYLFAPDEPVAGLPDEFRHGGISGRVSPNRQHTH